VEKPTRALATLTIFNVIALFLIVGMSYGGCTKQQTQTILDAAKIAKDGCLVVSVIDPNGKASEVCATGSEVVEMVEFIAQKRKAHLSASAVVSSEPPKTAPSASNSGGK